MSRALAGLLVGLITLYQRLLSPLLGARCRFYPTCSQYAKDCFQKDPLIIAARKTGRRLLCCQPFHPGGIDLP